MDKEVLRNEISDLIVSIAEQFSVIEIEDKSAEEQFKMFLRTIDELKYKGIALEVLNNLNFPDPVIVTKPVEEQNPITVKEVIPVVESTPEPEIIPEPALIKETKKVETVALEIPFDEPSVIEKPIEEIPKVEFKEENTSAKEVVDEEKIEEKVEGVKEEEIPVVVSTSTEEVQIDAAPVKIKVIEDIKETAIVEVKVREENNVEDKVETVAAADLSKILISIGDKYEFINAVFKKDSEAYKASLEKLNSLTSLSSSMKVIVEIQKKNNLQDDNETLERFVKLIENRYA